MYKLILDDADEGNPCHQLIGPNINGQCEVIRFYKTDKEISMICWYVCGLHSLIEQQIEITMVFDNVSEAIAWIKDYMNLEVI